MHRRCVGAGPGATLVIPLAVSSARAAPAPRTAIVHARVAALLVIEEPTVIQANLARIERFAADHRLPTITGSEVYAGSLMIYGPSYAAMFRRTAFYVDRILKGAKPADLPVEEPTTFELVVNLKAATALDVTIPRPVLLRADRVIEERAPRRGGRRSRSPRNRPCYPFISRTTRAKRGSSSRGWNDG